MVCISKERSRTIDLFIVSMVLWEVRDIAFELSGAGWHSKANPDVHLLFSLVSTWNLNVTFSMSDPDQHYTDPEEIRKALHLRDAGVLPPGKLYCFQPGYRSWRALTSISPLVALNTLKDQLQEATKIRVDPMEKRTRPLVEYVQQCQDGSDLLDLWDYQTSVSSQ